MDPRNWEELAGTVVDGRFRLRTLTYAQGDQADWIAEDEVERKGNPVALTLIEASPPEADSLRAKLIESAGLQNAHLLRILGGGDARIPGAPLLYLASESADETLAERLRKRTLAEGEARSLAGDVIRGLQYLHSRGLACRALEPQCIVRAGHTWKLADFARIHPIGVPDPGAASELNGSRYVPPEAYDGKVLAASDVWSLAVLMTEALAGTTAPVMLPEPFDRVCRACFETDPRRRPALDKVAAALGVPAPKANAPEPLKPQAGPPVVPAPAAAAAKPAPVRTWQVRPPLDLARFRMYAIPAAALFVLIVLWILLRPAQPPVTAPAQKSVPKAGQPAPAPAPAPPAAKPQPLITGRADFTGSDMDGRRTASGERFSNRALTAAHPEYPFGTRVRVTNLANGRSVIVTINDRGSLRRGYVIRLTRRAARELGFGRSPSARVSLEVVE